MTEEEKQIIDTALSAAKAGNAEQLLSLIDSDKETVLLTMKDGYKILFKTKFTENFLFDTWTAIEIHPENGLGYYCEMNKRDDGTQTYYRATCNCVAWQWNGEVLSVFEGNYSPEASAFKHIESTQTGLMVNGLRHGETNQTTTQIDHKGNKAVLVYQTTFSDGCTNEITVTEYIDDIDYYYTNKNQVDFVNNGICTDLRHSGAWGDAQVEIWGDTPIGEGAEK